MGIVAFILSISSLVTLVGYLWLVVAGFRKNVFWGIMVLLFSPLTAIIFAALNWFETKRAFLTYIIPSLISVGTVIYVFSGITPQQLEEIQKRMRAGELTLTDAIVLLDSANRMPAADQEQVPDATKQDNKNASTAETATLPDSSKTVEKAGPGDNANKPKDKDKPVASEEDTTTKQDSPRPSTGFPKFSEVQKDPLALQKQADDPDFILLPYEQVHKYQGRYFVIFTKKQTFLRGLLVKADDKAMYLNRKMFGGSFEFYLQKAKIDKIFMLKKKFVLDRDRNRLPKP